MTVPMPPESEAQRRARIRDELAYLQGEVRAGRARPQVIDAYVRRERITPEQELARMPMTAGETAGNVARAVYQGATLNFGDEIMGTVRGITDPNLTVAEGIADERNQLDRLRTEMPKTALASELAGGVATGIGALRAAGTLPKLMVAAPIRTAAATGAIAGAGAGESPTGRAVSAAGGAVVGGVLGAAADKVARSVPVQRGVQAVRTAVDDLQASGQPAVEATMPTRLRTPRVTAARQSVARVLADETGSMDAARTQLAELQAAGMGDEALLLNTGGEPAARVARAVANAPSVPFARTSANEVLGDALARQGGALGDQVSDDIARATGLGGKPGPVVLADMQDELASRTGAAFENFRQRGDLLQGALANNQQKLATFLADDNVAEVLAPRIAAIRAADPELRTAPVTDARFLDELFKDVQADLRGARQAMQSGNRGNASADVRRLSAVRDAMLDAIGEVDPAYATAVRQYALDEDVGKVVQRGFDRGLQLPQRGTPVGTFTAEARRLPAAGAQAMRAGAATAYQSAADDVASNVALGELAKFRDVARNVVGTKGQAKKFTEIFGERAYNDLLGRLKPKIRAAALNAIVRGNSTTARQLLDALAIGEDAVVDVLSAATSGQGLVAAVVQKLRAPVAAIRAAGLGETATDAAKLLTVRGPRRIKIAQDALERIAKEELARRRAVQPVAGAASRALLDRVP